MSGRNRQENAEMTTLMQSLLKKQKQEKKAGGR